MFVKKFTPSQPKNRYNFDWILLIISFKLFCLGVVFIYSAGFNTIDGVTDSTYIKQCFFLLPGCILLILFGGIHYQKISNFYLPLYLFGICMLVATLLWGKRIHGSKSWLTLFDMSLQSSEFTKIIFIISFAKYLHVFFNQMQKLTCFVFSLMIPAPIVFLILLQPDLGTALVYIPITFSMLFMTECKLKHIMITCIIGLMSLTTTVYMHYTIQEKKMIPTSTEQPNNAKNIKTNLGKIPKNLISFWFKLSMIPGTLLLMSIVMQRKFPGTWWERAKTMGFIGLTSILISIPTQLILKPHHLNRMISFTNLQKDRQGLNYNQRQSIIAIGSGGIIGHNFLQGPQNHLNYIPENKTDFIFAVIGEEWGFVRGSLLIFLLFFILLQRSLSITFHAKDNLGMLIGTGISCLLFTHIFINIGMSSGLLPVMGIPLPFLSAGGSFLLTCFACTGLLLNVSQHRFVH